VTAIRVLHVDDEPDLRAAVKVSLDIGSGFAVRGCNSGRDAVAAAIAWPPHLILIDVVMPGMDGPATLASLRRTRQTAEIPVVFMTARSLATEQEHFKSLGAVGVIAKPFDPRTLAATVRKHLRLAGIVALRKGFVERLRGNARLLIDCRLRLSAGTEPSRAALGEITAVAHALAGAAGIFGFQDISCSAGKLERVAQSRLRLDCANADVESALDRLISRIADT
jgi:DNA-binding response OmpR family regulator